MGLGITQVFTGTSYGNVSESCCCLSMMLQYIPGSSPEEGRGSAALSSLVIGWCYWGGGGALTHLAPPPLGVSLRRVSLRLRYWLRWGEAGRDGEKRSDEKKKKKELGVELKEGAGLMWESAPVAPPPPAPVCSCCVPVVGGRWTSFAPRCSTWGRRWGSVWPSGRGAGGGRGAQASGSRSRGAGPPGSVEGPSQWEGVCQNYNN
jgi:hypothetical protein